MYVYLLDKEDKSISYKNREMCKTVNPYMKITLGMNEKSIVRFVRGMKACVVNTKLLTVSLVIFIRCRSIRFN